MEHKLIIMAWSGSFLFSWAVPDLAAKLRFTFDNAEYVFKRDSFRNEPYPI